MEYPLDPLEDLVSELTGESRNPPGLLGEAGAGELLKAIQKETVTLRDQIVKQVFQISRAKEIERLIQHYQSALTGLMDRIYQQDIQHPARPSVLRRVYDGFYQSVLDLLSFIEERFSKYFDTDEKVPEIYFVLMATELEAERKEVIDPENFTGPDREVMDLLSAGYIRFLKAESRKTVSYREMIYRKTLVKELKELAENPDGEQGRVSFSATEQVLIYINYNDREFVQYMVDRLAAVISEPEDLREQIGLVLQLSKDLHQLPLKPDTALLTRHPSLADQLSAWLSEELYFLERRMNMFAISGTRTTLSEKKAIVECRVPVDQLGIFLRAASETRLLSTPSQKKLFEQIAPYLSTPRRGTLSADSMRSKSYSPERRDIQGVKDLLMVIYKQVGKY
jgi:hypothetical protein